MTELKRENNDLFENFYTGSIYMNNGKIKTVNCILDDNCVRYIIKVGNRITSRREYGNTEKDTCLRKATLALNK